MPVINTAVAAARSKWVCPPDVVVGLWGRYYDNQGFNRKRSCAESNTGIHDRLCKMSPNLFTIPVACLYVPDPHDLHPRKNVTFRRD